MSTVAAPLRLAAGNNRLFLMNDDGGETKHWGTMSYTKLQLSNKMLSFKADLRNVGCGCAAERIGPVISLSVILSSVSLSSPDCPPSGAMRRCTSSP